MWSHYTASSQTKDVNSGRFKVDLTIHADCISKYHNGAVTRVHNAADNAYSKWLYFRILNEKCVCVQGNPKNSCPSPGGPRLGWSVTPWQPEEAGSVLKGG